MTKCDWCHRPMDSADAALKPSPYTGDDIRVCQKCERLWDADNEFLGRTSVPIRPAPKMQGRPQAKYVPSHSLDPHQDGGDDGW